MDYPLNAEVHCTDGRYGRSTRLILNPAAEKVTHVVVRDARSPHSERMLPVRWIRQTTPEIILVNGTKEEVRTLECFDRTEFVRRAVPHYGRDPKMTELWPFLVPAQKVMSERQRGVSEGEVALRTGARVRAVDGRIGRIDEFIVSPDTWRITHMVVRKGPPWNERQVAIPVTEIARIEEDAVHLKMDRAAVRRLPATRRS